MRSTNEEKTGVVFWGKRPRSALHTGQRLRVLPGALPGVGRATVSGGKWPTLVVCMDPRERNRGASSTPNTSAWPNDAAVCSLWQVLERVQSRRGSFEFDGVRRDSAPSRGTREGDSPAPLSRALREVSTRR